MQTLSHRPSSERWTEPQCGDREGGETEPLRENHGNAGVEVRAERPAVTHRSADRQGRLPPQFLSQAAMTVKVEAGQLPQAELEGCGQKDSERCRYEPSRARLRWKEDASVAHSSPSSELYPNMGSPWPLINTEAVVAPPAPGT